MLQIRLDGLVSGALLIIHVYLQKFASHRQSEASPYDSRLFCRGKHASTGLHCKVWHCLPVGRLVRYLNGNIHTFRRYSNYRVCVAQRLVISKFGTAIKPIMAGILSMNRQPKRNPSQRKFHHPLIIIPFSREELRKAQRRDQ